MEYKVMITDTDTGKDYETLVKARSDATIKRVVLKAVEQVVESISSDSLEFMREVNYIYREAFDSDDFVEQLKMDLDLVVTWEEV